MKTKIIAKLGALALLVASAGAQADISIVGGEIYVAQTGNVTATFLGSDAGYTDVLFFDPLNLNQILFSGHSTAVGTTVSLGSFAAGTKLSFRMHVNDTGNDFYTGAASNNADGVVHAHAWLNANNEAIVGFEDLYGGGDLDYNDIQFRVSNVAAIPEPETFAMLMAGLGLVGAVARRRQQKKTAA